MITYNEGIGRSGEGRKQAWQKRVGTGDATHDDAHAVASGKHDGITAAVWRARPVQADLLTRRGRFD